MLDSILVDILPSIIMSIGNDDIKDSMTLAECGLHDGSELDFVAWTVSQEGFPYEPLPATAQSAPSHFPNIVKTNQATPSQK